MASKRIQDVCFDKVQYMEEENSKHKTTASKIKFLAFSPSWSQITKKLQKTNNTRHELFLSQKNYRK